MGGTYNLTVENKGRIVIPAAIRERQSWTAGTPLIAIESTAGFTVMSRESAHRMVQGQLAGHDLVAELLRERRVEAARESTTPADAA